MAATRTAKLFKRGRSQAVRLLKEFRMAGAEVRGRGVLLEPIEHDLAEVAAIFADAAVCLCLKRSTPAYAPHASARVIGIRCLRRSPQARSKMTRSSPTNA
jgi:virulence-associated protein VagC